MTSPYGPPAPPPDPGFVTGLAYGALAVLGAMLGLFGSFEFSWEFGGLPVAAIGLAAVNLFLFRSAGWGMESRLGATVPLVTWMLVVVLLSSARPEGDLVVTGTIPGYVFIFGGTVAGALAIAWTRSVRPWMLRGADHAPGAPGPA